MITPRRLFSFTRRGTMRMLRMIRAITLSGPISMRVRDGKPSAVMEYTFWNIMNGNRTRNTRLLSFSRKGLSVHLKRTTRYPMPR